MASAESRPTYRFGDFVLDAAAFRLSRNGQPLKIEPKALDVLVYLVEHRGEVVSKHDLLSAVWNGVAVTDNAVTRVVAAIRRALDDRPDDPCYIETIPTRGYRFVPEVGIDVPIPAAVPGPPALRPAWSRRAFLVAGFALLAVAAGALAMRGRVSGQPATAGRDPGRTASEARTMAILPLRNVSGDAGQDYLADGITQSLADRFSEFGSPAVIATTSSVRYRDSALPATQIAGELGADLLVEGSVARSGTRVRVSVSLVDGASGRRVWTHKYDRQFADLFAVYDEIASSVGGETKLAVEAVAATRRAHGPVNPGAYDDYLRAMSLLGNRWMAGGCQDAERALLGVVEHDPTFAPAYAALAWCYAYPDRLGRAFAETGPKAKAAVSKALSLDDRLALAHVVAGTIAWRMEHDAVRGEAELRRARELDPNAGLVLIPSAEILMWRGKVDEGLPLLDRAAALDPFSPDRQTQVAFDLLIVGRYEAAAEHFSRALALEPSYLAARYWLAETFALAGRPDAAVREYLSWLDGALVPGRARGARSDLEAAWQAGGWQAFWQREMALVEEEVARPGSVWGDAQRRYTGPWYQARRYARLGKWDRALDCLETAFARRHHLMATLPIEPLFAPLRANPRFRKLARRIGAS